MAEQEDGIVQPKLGRRATPEDDWGEALEGEAQYGANHLAREDRPEPDRGKGTKTRAAHKDIVSRRV